MRIGDVVMGRYRITHVLARGGMGEVYLARVEGAEGFVRPAVIKRILPMYSTDDEMVRMFVREARLLADLHHPTIVSVLDFASEEDGHLMALDYVHGYSVRHWAKYLKQEGREIPTWTAVWIIIQVLDALHYAHTRTDVKTGAALGIVHRDVSPSNVLVDTEGHVRLLDFGVATQLGQHTAPKAGEVNLRGKFPYLSPELFDGAQNGPHTDLYACGVLLHELLVGENEFRRKDTNQTIRLVLTHELSKPSALRDDVTEELDAVIAKAVAKQPNQRYEKAGELAEALRALLPMRENELREQLRELARADFFGDMPEKLVLEPLDALENAWKHAPDEQDSIVTIDPPPRPDRVAETEPGVAILSAEAPEGPAQIPGPALEREAAPTAVATPLPRSRAVLIAGVVSALLLSIVGVFLALRPSADPERIVIVERRLGNETSEAHPPNEMPGDASAPNGAGDTNVEDGSGETHTKRPSRAQTRVARLTASFGRRRGQLRACFERHTQSLEGTPQISVRFQVTRDGHVQSAQLLPAALGPTPLGRCLQGVAASTEFGRQPEPATFRIPIRVRGD